MVVGSFFVCLFVCFVLFCFVLFLLCFCLFVCLFWVVLFFVGFFVVVFDFFIYFFGGGSFTRSPAFLRSAVSLACLKAPGTVLLGGEKLMIFVMTGTSSSTHCFIRGV